MAGAVGAGGWGSPRAVLRGGGGGIWVLRDGSL